MKHYALIAFDVDGTLVRTKSRSPVRKNARDWQWLPGRLKKLRELEQQGVKVAIATNQAGVAFGYLPQNDLHEELVRMMQEANLPLSALYVCYTHPRATVSKFMEIESDICRKPNPAMLIEAMRDFGVPANETLYVGDRPIDGATAKNAGVDFSWANAFFHGQT